MPRELIDCMRSKRFTSRSAIGARLIADALFTTMSTPPNFSAVWATASATWASSRTSPTIGSAWPPASSISSAAVNTVPGSFGWGSAVFAISATFAPSCAIRFAIARPIPRLPPDMTTVRP